MECERMKKLQIPNPKFQTNRKSQIPSEGPLFASFGSWSLEFFWDLGFGIWDLADP